MTDDFEYEEDDSFLLEAADQLEAEYLQRTAASNDPSTHAPQTQHVRSDPFLITSGEVTRATALGVQPLKTLPERPASDHREKPVTTTRQTTLPWVQERASDLTLSTGLTQLSQCKSFDPSPVGPHPERSSTLLLPKHPPVRDYQRDIISTAVLDNTLVSLPTGTGKTLIAAVLMQNFLRWFPGRLVVFLAPTKPLVHQQRKACQDIMGIKSSIMAEMTGEQSIGQRKSNWEQKSMVFATPQILDNDLSRGDCQAQRIILVVVDEAHKATGRHATVKVIEELTHKVEGGFRVLALTATPGSQINRVQSVVSNLSISKIEIRDESDDQVKQYLHQKERAVITVAQAPMIAALCQRIRGVAERVVRRLRAGNFVPFCKGPVTADLLVMARKGLQQREDRNGIMAALGDFTVAIGLLQSEKELDTITFSAALQTLERLKAEAEGARSVAKRELAGSAEVEEVVAELRRHAAEAESVHPKVRRLCAVLEEHMRAAEEATRALVFVSCRSGMAEIRGALACLGPAVKVEAFVGQAGSGGQRGMRQREQEEALGRFREGRVNTLLCTCVAEEGLDVGEVDLIVEYDTVKSAVRQVQRAGRTGRRRAGRVVSLVMEGGEAAAQAQAEKKSRGALKQMRKLRRSDGGGLRFYRGNAPLLPRAPRPVEFDFPPADHAHTPAKRRARKPGKQRQGPGLSTQEQEWLEGEEALLGGAGGRDLEESPLDLAAWPEWQQAPTAVHRVPHSRRSRRLVEFMRRIADYSPSQHAPSQLLVSQDPKVAYGNEKKPRTAGGIGEGAAADGKRDRGQTKRRKVQAMLASSSEEDVEEGGAGEARGGTKRPEMGGDAAVEAPDGAHRGCNLAASAVVGGEEDVICVDDDTQDAVHCEDGVGVERGNAPTQHSDEGESAGIGHDAATNRAESPSSLGWEGELDEMFPSIDEATIKHYFPSPPGAESAESSDCEEEDAEMEDAEAEEDALASDIDDGEVTEHVDKLQPDADRVDPSQHARKSMLPSFDLGDSSDDDDEDFQPSSSATGHAASTVGPPALPQPVARPPPPKARAATFGVIGDASPEVGQRTGNQPQVQSQSDRDDRLSQLPPVSTPAREPRDVAEISSRNQVQEVQKASPAHEGPHEATRAPALIQSPAGSSQVSLHLRDAMQGAATRRSPFSPPAVLPSRFGLPNCQKPVVCNLPKFDLASSSEDEGGAPAAAETTTAHPLPGNSSTALPGQSPQGRMAAVVPPSESPSTPAPPAHRPAPGQARATPQQPGVLPPSSEGLRGVCAAASTPRVGVPRSPAQSLSADASARPQPNAESAAGSPTLASRHSVPQRSSRDNEQEEAAAAAEEEAEESPVRIQRDPSKPRRVFFSPEEEPRGSSQLSAGSPIPKLQGMGRSPSTSSPRQAGGSGAVHASAARDEGDRGRGALRYGVEASAMRRGSGQNQTQRAAAPTALPRANAILAEDSEDDFELEPRSKRPRRPGVLAGESNAAKAKSERKAEARVAEERKERKRKKRAARQRYCADEASQSDDCEVSADEEDGGSEEEEEGSDEAGMINDGDEQAGASQSGITPKTMRGIYAQSLMHSQSKEMGFGPLRGGRFKMNYRDKRALCSGSSEEEGAAESEDDEMEDFIVDSAEEEEGEEDDDEDGLAAVEQWEEEQARLETEGSRKRVLVDASDDSDEDASQHGSSGASPEEAPRPRGLRGRLTVPRRRQRAQGPPSPEEAQGRREGAVRARKRVRPSLCSPDSDDARPGVHAGQDARAGRGAGAGVQPKRLLDSESLGGPAVGTHSAGAAAKEGAAACSSSSSAGGRRAMPSFDLGASSEEEEEGPQSSPAGRSCTMEQPPGSAGGLGAGREEAERPPGRQSAAAGQSHVGQGSVGAGDRSGQALQRVPLAAVKVSAANNVERAAPRGRGGLGCAKAEECAAWPSQVVVAEEEGVAMEEDCEVVGALGDAESKEVRGRVAPPVVLLSRAEGASQLGQSLRGLQRAGLVKVVEGRRVRGASCVLGLEHAVTRMRVADVVGGARSGALAARLGELASAYERPVLLIDLSQPAKGGAVDPLVADGGRVAEVVAMVRTHAREVTVLTSRSGEEAARLVVSLAREEARRGGGLGWLRKEELVRYISGDQENNSVDLVAAAAGLNLAAAVYVIHEQPSLAELAEALVGVGSDGPVGAAAAAQKLAAALPALAEERVRALAEALVRVYS